MHDSHQCFINKKFGKGIVLKQVPKPDHVKRNGLGTVAIKSKEI